MVTYKKVLLKIYLEFILLKIYLEFQLFNLYEI